ncbi:FMN reductase [Actinorhabdospora filicis]|uniref:FMN reductase n=1 Tax=Actinorhabdospora filicis TaxID=1785913 RepID=A0A9W6W2R4_9ACTN|nr:NAD(P)H-dependent oxidoreductase [Actinorhabdospora filicis]GLZ77302.1 FMN reductase [Actinorhabdospora filicis]
MTHEPYRLAVIIASVRDGRFAPVVKNWFIDRAGRRPELKLDEVDLAEVAPGPGFTAGIGAADAIVVITPEYNHSFPGPLKTAIDSVGAEWRGKPVAFVSYGGISGGLRAVEALRPVFAELHAVTIRETVSFHGAWGRFDADGQPHDAEKVDAALAALLDQLEWWAESLREARTARPYVAS